MGSLNSLQILRLSHLSQYHNYGEGVQPDPNSITSFNWDVKLKEVIGPEKKIETASIQILAFKILVGTFNLNDCKIRNILSQFESNIFISKGIWRLIKVKINDAGSEIFVLDCCSCCLLFITRTTTLLTQCLLLVLTLCWATALAGGI